MTQMHSNMLLLTEILRNLRRRKPQQVPSRAHRVASQYWRSCSNTFLANSEYYEKCEAALRDDILPKCGVIDRALDLGCGNGRFTFLLAKAARAVDASDLSPVLIDQARRRARENGTKNIRFKVEDITFAKPRASAYGLVSCMGVLSTIIDDWVFRQVTRALRGAVRPGGWLLVRETLSLLEQGQIVESEGYAIRYRNEDAYRKEFAALGLMLEYEAPLIEAGNLHNRLHLFRVPGRS